MINCPLITSPLTHPSPLRPPPSIAKIVRIFPSLALTLTLTPENFFEKFLSLVLVREAGSSKDQCGKDTCSWTRKAVLTEGTFEPLPSKEQKMTHHTKSIPEGFHTMTPHLVVKGASQAIEFYKKAFGAQELGRMPGPDGTSIMHAHLKIGDSNLFLNDEFPQMGCLWSRKWH